jgi:hypothetical protein
MPVKTYKSLDDQRSFTPGTRASIRNFSTRRAEFFRGKELGVHRHQLAREAKRTADDGCHLMTRCGL